SNLDPGRRPGGVRARGRPAPRRGDVVTSVVGTAPSLASIRDKVRAGQALAFEDGVALYRHPNLMEVGALANEVRERLHGDRTYFNRNMHINATNVCEASCMFCSFARLVVGDAGACASSHARPFGSPLAALAGCG